MTNVAWRFFNHNEWSESDFENKTVPEVKEMLIDKLKANLEDKKTAFPGIIPRILKVIMLRVVDRYWMDHIDQMSELRQSIGLNPMPKSIRSGISEIGFEMFETMVNNIEEEVVTFVSRAQIRDNLERKKWPSLPEPMREEPVKKKPVVVGKNRRKTVSVRQR